MATNANKDQKRKTRAARRAAEEAAAKARAEQAAKERKQQTIIGAIVVAVVVVLVAVAGIAIWRSHVASQNSGDNLSVDQAYAKLQEVKDKPSTADEKGGILVSQSGVGKKVDGAPTVQVYMDFMCSGCGNFERASGETLEKMVLAGQINLELHPMSFGDTWSTDKYSTRAANMLLSITEQDQDPEHILGFIRNMYADDFQPAENSGVKTSDDQMKKQATKAGVSQKVADASVTDKYTKWLDAINVYNPKRSELFNVSGTYKGQMTTPTVLINGKYWDMNELTTAGMTSKEGLITSLGLTDAQVGVEGQMPSIGASGKPVSVTTGK
ncbi:DsbA family protein [Bifidobacterium platyrrhinorum]|uniref:Thioredoxin domain-containing protein n=1 Tax=Bifidobacterium platyrrhinorum TaxID=2661628 RepID=A0A6L9SSP6_9BIFI|nr:thioredoxin domain-containing protein [Bifidobacterium platyrrhinorum]NEG55636.1 thioredoxin domain-containing protein [Bifidobacterium platyrrhinorum]